MTKKHKLNHCGYACKLNCADCPLSHLNNGSTMLCSDFETFYPEKAIAIVQKWSDEHPQKTYLSEFLKKYPNALLNDRGVMAFPKNLKALRLKHKLTQDELGEKLYLSRTSISNYEQGKFEPNIETIIAISDLFNITTDELLK